MSVESAAAFLRKLVVDAELLARVEAAPSDEAKQEIAKEAGFSFTQADTEQLKQELQRELADEELETVAGGASIPLVQRPVFNAAELRSLKNDTSSCAVAVATCAAN